MGLDRQPRQPPSTAMKFKMYPVAIAVLLLGLLTLFFGRYQIDISVEPPVEPPISVSPSPLPSPEPLPQPSPQPIPPPVTTVPGQLRVSNQTPHPVRIALLAKKDASYDQPAHWDFAPQEGGTQGLILSLPNRKIQLGKGDVLVAFAQDGSRQYWGPFVVGETRIPLWSSATKEWLLILQP